MGSNHLVSEKSPYLLQHQHNPVQWYPWGETAFGLARTQQKPIFLSIGYSTCHWCHVMAHESFENPAIAAILNEHFINVKVDREERPDVDQVYMTFVQATTGHGGWPMSVWLTPDLQPFVGGTYFPPVDRYGRPGFPTVLRQIAEAWTNNRDGVLKQGENVVRQLRDYVSRQGEKSEDPTVEIFRNGLKQIARSFDREEGGFSGAPKFPRPAILRLLHRLTQLTDLTEEEHKVARFMSEHTLNKMADGGMHDHLGGGFHRYAVDEFWHVPHFEKMLYDQAQLAAAYLEMYQLSGDRRYAAVVRDVADYVLRDLTDAQGGFYSAEDADSLLAHGKTDHAEGAFYVWTKSEITGILDEPTTALFNDYYGVREGGNAPEGSDPQAEFTGKNILILRHPIIGQDNEILERARERLAVERAKRPRPHLDDKVITAWNGLMISALARAGFALPEPRYILGAVRAAEFVQRELYDAQTKRLKRSYRQGAGAVEGFASDYAFLVQALLDLYGATFEIRWLKWAEDLQETQDKLFWDEKNGGYFSTTEEASDILLRLKEDHDGAEPSPNSVAAENLQRLSVLLGREAWSARAGQVIRSLAPVLEKALVTLPQMGLALAEELAPAAQIVLIGERLALEPFLAKLRGKISGTVMVLNDKTSEEFFREHLPWIREMKPVDGKATAYVCRDFVCEAPLTDAGQFEP